jgi:hypothetical protein
MTKAVVGIRLDRDRGLFFRTRDLVDMETALGNESVEEAIAKRGYKRLVVFLWAGLRYNEERLKQEDVLKMIDKTDLSYIQMWDKISEALVASGRLPKPGESDAAVPSQAPAPGTTDG